MATRTSGSEVRAGETDTPKGGTAPRPDPYHPAKVWCNGHEWAKRQAEHAGVGFTALADGFATCTEPDRLQAICDRFGPDDVQAFFDRWIDRIPTPFTADDRDAGYW